MSVLLISSLTNHWNITKSNAFLTHRPTLHESAKLVPIIYVNIYVLWPVGVCLSCFNILFHYFVCKYIPPCFSRLSDYLPLIFWSRKSNDATSNYSSKSIMCGPSCSLTTGSWLPNHWEGDCPILDGTGNKIFYFLAWARGERNDCFRWLSPWREIFLCA